MINSTASRVVMVAKAASRGALSNEKVLRTVVGGSSVRFLSLPPGSVRNKSIRDHSVLEGNTLNHDDDEVLLQDSRPRVQSTMSPRVRRFGTSSLDVPDYNGIQSSSTLHTPASPYDEDYDEWNLHRPPSSTTKSDLGRLEEYDPVIQSLLLTSTLGDSSIEYSSPFENVNAVDEDWKIPQENEIAKTVS